jgi:uncharacterized protein (DUF2147 family)
MSTSRLATGSMLLASMLLFGQPGSASAAASPMGRWLTDNGNLEIEIAPCGKAICGTVVKVLANRSMSGSGEMTAADKRDPMGMVILKDFAPSGEGAWKGEIYNRENAKTYDCELSLGAPDQLVLRPYIGLPILGKTLVWRRVGADAAKK